MTRSEWRENARTAYGLLRDDGLVAWALVVIVIAVSFLSLVEFLLWLQELVGFNT